MKKKIVHPIIPFKCIKGNYSCPFVDTLSSTLDRDCKTCNYTEENYYDIKQQKRLHSFKEDLIAIIGLIIIYIGYECWINNHFLLYCTGIIAILLLWFSICATINNKEYDKIFDEEIDKNNLKT